MSRSNTKKSPYLALTSSYAIALSVVALLFVGANILVGQAIEDQRKVALALDLTGRQRLLGQRIAWLADRYASRGDAAARGELQTAISDLTATADNLRLGRVGADTSLAVPPGVARIYAEQNLTARLRLFLTHARAIAFNDIAPGEGPRATDDLAAILAEADGPLLATLDAVGAEYVTAADAKIDRLQTYQNATLLVILLTLAAEALFVFRPLVGKVTSYVDEVLEHSRRASSARRAAQQASAAKSAFLSNMSHELRTPMTGIMGLCDLLISGPQSTEQAKMTRMLRQSAQVLLDLLNDILDLAKIEAGRMTMESIDFNLPALVDDVRNLFDTGMAEKGLAFTVDNSLEDQDTFRGDPKHTRQILCNLVGNALKFTETGAVRLRYWNETDDAGRTVLKFSVTDTGIGISEEGLTRLFRKFEQEDRATARQYGGTGLGLAICKQLSEALGGGIEVKSTKGLGSTFTFHVRVEPGDPAAVTAAAVATPAGAGDELAGHTLRILLAEDNLTTQFILNRMLSLWGQSVTTVADGKSAAARATQESFDVILMDMQMPVMDGDEAARRIREAQGASAGAPIIALTADGIVEHHQRYLDAGCDVVLTKPVVWKDLAREIRVRAGLAPGEAPAQTRTAGAEPVAATLNLDMFSTLQDVLPPADLEEILRKFIDSMEDYRLQLEEHLVEGDLAQAKRTAHTVKGLSAQIGADEVAAIAGWIEMTAASVDEVAAAMPRLEAAMERACAAVLVAVPGADPLK